jgi:hypothetical protein
MLREGRIDDDTFIGILRACESYKNRIKNNVSYRIRFMFTSVSQYGKVTGKYNMFK